jgi:hypothetical protein
MMPLSRASCMNRQHREEEARLQDLSTATTLLIVRNGRDVPLESATLLSLQHHSLRQSASA